MSNTPVSQIVVDQVSKWFAGSAALNEVSLAIAPGEFVTLLGPSGCGKSTTLRAIAGLTAIDKGRVLMAGQDVTALHASKRNIGMVFQNHALFPHLSVADNVAFGLKMRGISRSERGPRVAEALDLVKLGAMAGRWPQQLSGGQQQRVAIARALVTRPAVLLLDEPFAALDRKLREEMQVELRELTRRVGITSVFVTHDQEEALTLSDRVVLMNAGRIEQAGTPDDLYARPETAFAADFMGIRNILEARLTARQDGALKLAWDGGPLAAVAPADYRLPVSGPLQVAIRPEQLRLSDAAAEPVNATRGTVIARIDHGAFLAISLRTGCGAVLVAHHPKATPLDPALLQPGRETAISWSREAVIVLRADPRNQST
jgi:spermidine/putrescine ABC transporter ATP-binding subunit